MTRAAAAAWIARPVAFEPVNVIASTSRMGDERRADGLTGALDDVEHARRDARLDRQLGDQDRRHRCLLGRLEDDAVAGAERERAHRGCRHRPVPRHDRSDHAERLAHLVDGELARHCGDAAVQLRGPARVVVDPVDGELDDEARVEPEQAGVDHVELGELVGVLGDQRGEPAQPPLLLERRQVAPAAVVERRAGGPHRALDVRGGPGGCGRDLLAGGGIDHRHRAALERGHDLAVDDVAEQRPVQLPCGGGRDRIRGRVSQHAHRQLSLCLLGARAQDPDPTLVQVRRSRSCCQVHDTISVDEPLT